MPCCTVEKVFGIDFAPYLPPDRTQVFAAYELFENEVCLASGTTLFAKPKHIHFEKPVLQTELIEDADGYTLSLTSSAFAHYVEIDFAEIDCLLSDNYFDITNAAPKKVRIEKNDIRTKNVTREMLCAQLRLKTVAHSY